MHPNSRARRPSNQALCFEVLRAGRAIGELPGFGWFEPHRMGVFRPSAVESLQDNEDKFNPVRRFRKSHESIAEVAETEET